VTGERLGGRYLLERRLGLGGMAVVHLARDEILDRHVAVKILADRHGDDDEFRARFHREGRVAARLSHPNIVTVYDTGEQDGRPYIVMEYVEGSTLAEELQRRRTMPAAEVAELGSQASSGLAHAHDAGLVHRDVKPHNLLLRNDGVLKVADFGIARGGLDGTLTQAGTLLGTAAYMAPEVLNGERATPAADIYSLGAVLYELLTGRPPRKIESFADLGEQETITEPGRLVPDPPPALVATIMRCLDPDPLRRPAAAELALELGGSEATTTPSQPVTTVRHASRRRRLWLVPAAALTVLGIAFALSLRGEDDPPAPAPRVEPVRTGSSPAEEARNLSEWLRANSG
jgi:eukaryotic-like serine/threonine-protein kinase